MSVEIVTKEDLQAFRFQLLNDLKALFFLPGQNEKKEWLKSNEIRKMLRISPVLYKICELVAKLLLPKLGEYFFTGKTTWTNYLILMMSRQYPNEPHLVS